MKQSYFSAPRRLAEATFLGGCDPIERPEPRRVSRTAVAVSACLVFAAVVMAVWVR